MPAPVAGIHVLRLFNNKDVDGRDKPGHDDGKVEIEDGWYETGCPRCGTL
jgi:hypothetical protein